MAKESGNSAIVLGASGLIGWSVVEQLLLSDSFARVTAVTNRPVRLEESHWPLPEAGRPPLQLVSGVDLRDADAASLAASLRRKAEGLDKITHVYYFAFVSGSDFIEEVAVNKKMLQNAIDAFAVLGAPLKFVVFPGGTRGYGIYVPGGTFQPPLTEDLVHDLPEDYAKTVVYPQFRRVLSAACEGKSWTWCEVCPDAIVGFTPNGSQFSLALHWAQYLSLYAHGHGVGPRATGSHREPVKVPFPGIEEAYNSKSTSVSARTIARFAIYASLHPEKCGGGQLFNVGDSTTPSTCKDVWPRLAAWFGLVGEGPSNNSSNLEQGEDEDAKLMPGQYFEKYKDVFRRYGLNRAVKAGVGTGSQQLDSVGTWLTFDRQLSLKKLRESGFMEERDPALGWFEAFEKFREANLIL